jgi:hypothetical protein
MRYCYFNIIQWRKSGSKTTFGYFWKKMLRRLRSHIFYYFPLDLEDYKLLIILSLFLKRIVDLGKQIISYCKEMELQPYLKD